MSQYPLQVQIAIGDADTDRAAEWLTRPLLRGAAVVGVSERIRWLPFTELAHSTELAPALDLDLLVFGQLTPAAISPATLAGWHDRFPLARRVTVWGPWCIGGHRSGYAVPGSIEVSWLSWRWQIQNFLRQFFSNQETPWDLPATRSPADRLARLASPIVRPRVSVATPVPDGSAGKWLDLVPSAMGLGLALEQACRALGHPSRVWQNISELMGRPAHERAPIWVWEPDVGRTSFAQIVQMRQQLTGPGILLLGYAEILAATDSLDWAAELTPSAFAGAATALLPKPFSLSELQSAICDLSF